MPSSATQVRALDPAEAFAPDPVQHQLLQNSIEALKLEGLDPDNVEPWEAQQGSQLRFLRCPTPEVLYSGERGPGKTDSLLMDFAQNVGIGYGTYWRGVIFRRTYPELADIIEKSMRWFSIIFPDAKYNSQKSYWRFATGETLLFRNFAKPADYWSYHGHEYPFIGWEELTNWPDDRCYRSMFSCSRSSLPNMPRWIRATTNPYGVGHSWVKLRWRLDGCPKIGQVMTKAITDAVDDDGIPEPPRRTFFGKLHENKILLAADPDYPSRVKASASNEAQAEAWMSGSWDIVSGGMFGADWDRDVHIVRPFNVPSTWRIDRGYDYGSSKPFAVLWFAESDGSDYRNEDGEWVSTVPGDIFVIREWYGWTGKPNEGKDTSMEDTARGIIEREMIWNIHHLTKPGPADSAIFTQQNGTSLAIEMGKPLRLTNGRRVNGVTWTKADKRPGSRVAGWKRLVDMLRQSKTPKGRLREKPGLFVVGEHCPQFVRTFPPLPRDEKNQDDVDTDAEDHIGDVVRYRVWSAPPKAIRGKTTGMT